MAARALALALALALAAPSATALSMWEAAGAELSKTLGRSVTLDRVGGGAAGGGGASVSTALASDGTKYFVKHGRLDDFAMLSAEATGVRAMYDTGTIKVPEPFCAGTSDSNSFAVFECLDLGGGRSDALSAEMGRQLAAMHRAESPSGEFGFEIDNTIGATPQPNGFMGTWAEFYVERRLKYMLKLTGGWSREAALCDRVRRHVLPLPLLPLLHPPRYCQLLL